MNRKKIIVRTSVVGIIVNIFLSGFKAFVGLVSHSITDFLYQAQNLHHRCPDCLFYSEQEVLKKKDAWD